MSSTLTEERLQILKMVEEKKLTSKEAIDLLAAIDQKNNEIVKRNKSKWLRIKVFEPDDQTKVNVNIPLSLIDVGLKIAKKFKPELDDELLKSIDLDEIIEAIKNGAEGKIVEVDSAKGERVEIFVE